MKKILILVRNNFITDRRVYNTAISLKICGYSPKIIAVNSFRNSKYIDDNQIEIKRINSFSSIYAKPRPSMNKISVNKQTNNLVKKIKNNSLRKTIIGLLNSLFYDLGCFFQSILFKPKYVWANDLNTLFIGFIISKTFRAKLIYDSHEIFTEGLTYQSLSKLEQTFMKKMEASIIKYTDAVIVTTDLRANFLKKLYSLEKVWTIMNCYKTAKISESNTLRDEFDIPKETKIFLYQGLIHRKRGVFFLADAIGKIEGTALVFMGNGSGKQELFNYIQHKKISNKVFIKDAVPMNLLMNYTASADVGFQLLENSGFNHYSTISNKVFEYIMAGLPIISSNFPELKKIVLGNDIGIVVEPDDSDALENAITQMIKDSSRYNKYKDNLKSIKHKYTWEIEESKIEEILKKI